MKSSLQKSKILAGGGGKIFVVFTLLFLVANPLFAEIIYLRNGGNMVGRIITQGSDFISLSSSGKSMRVWKKDIRLIRFAASDLEEDEIRLKNDMDQMQDWQKQLDRVLEKRRTEDEATEENQKTRVEEEKTFFSDELLELKKRKKRGGFIRSLIFPGWGQAYKGENWKAYSFISFTLLSAGYSYYNFKQYNKLSDSYNQANMNYLFLAYWQHNLALGYYLYDESVGYRNQMATNIKQGNIFIGTVAVVYLISALDAYWSDVDLGLENEFVSSHTKSSGSQWEVAIAPLLSGSAIPSKNNVVYTVRYSIYF